MQTVMSNNVKNYLDIEIKMKIRVSQVENGYGIDVEEIFFLS